MAPVGGKGGVGKGGTHTPTTVTRKGPSVRTQIDTLTRAKERGLGAKPKAPTRKELEEKLAAAMAQLEEAKKRMQRLEQQRAAATAQLEEARKGVEVYKKELPGAVRAFADTLQQTINQESGATAQEIKTRFDAFLKQADALAPDEQGYVEFWRQAEQRWNDSVKDIPQQQTVRGFYEHYVEIYRWVISLLAARVLEKADIKQRLATWVQAAEAAQQQACQQVEALQKELKDLSDRLGSNMKNLMAKTTRETNRDRWLCGGMGAVGIIAAIGSVTGILAPVIGVPVCIALTMGTAIISLKRHYEIAAIHDYANALAAGTGAETPKRNKRFRVAGILAAGMIIATMLVAGTMSYLAASYEDAFRKVEAAAKNIAADVDAAKNNPRENAPVAK